MPSSPLGLALFIILLAPGLAYVIQRELRAPGRNASTFRETAAVIFASLVFDVLVLVLFAAIRLVLPAQTPDVWRIVHHDAHPRYLEDHYRLLTAWGLCLIVAASLLAGIAGRYTPGVTQRFGRDISHSAWWDLARGRDVPKGHAVFVGCLLRDESYVSGELLSLSTDIEETQDRDLVLRPPISYRAVGVADTTELPVSALVVSAHQIKFVSFTYVPRPGDCMEVTDPEAEATETEASAS